MPIGRIVRLKGCGVFRDFTWPSGLPEFARYNLIYGWNGSGKTTISRILRALETRNGPPTGQVVLTVDGRVVSEGDFAQVTLPVRVFNRDFMAESVFPTEGDVAPIFVLGKENVEKQKQVALLKRTLDGEQAKLRTYRQMKSAAETVLDRFRIDKGTVIRDTLRSAGPNPYNNYDKRDFARRAEAMISACDMDASALRDGARDQLLAQLRGTPKSKVHPVTYRLPHLKALEKTVADLFSTTVVSAVIQSLKDDPNLSSWVHTGLGLHKGRDATKCLFCNQPMPNDRLPALEAHFSTEYEDLLRKLVEQITTIQAAIKAATDLDVPKAAEFYDYLSSEFERAAPALRRERDTAKRVLEAFVIALEDKKRRPFDEVALEMTAPDLDTGVVDNLNRIILKHNQACDDFQSRIDAARKQLEDDCVGTNLDEYLKLKENVKTAEGEVTRANDETQQLTGQITMLEREILDHLQPAEQLNEDLRHYLGHGELRLEVNGPGYTIMRDNVPAKSLSEGETTAVALLYFLKSLQDRRFDLSKGVVVLDDPVSSLDQNALFAAFGFIRARTQGAAQVIILAHNFTFFRMVRDWYRNLRGPDKKSWQVYMLQCRSEASGRCAALCAIDPLLMDFESEYHYLFSQVYRLATEPPASSLEVYYGVPSVARRVLEMFLAFRIPGARGHNRLWSQMLEIPFDDRRRSRIYRFLQTHSHRNAIGDADEDLSLLAESRSVLNDLLSFMREADDKHCARMIALVCSPGRETDS